MLAQNPRRILNKWRKSPVKKHHEKHPRMKWKLKMKQADKDNADVPALVMPMPLSMIESVLLALSGTI